MVWDNKRLQIQMYNKHTIQLLNEEEEEAAESAE